MIGLLMVKLLQDGTRSRGINVILAIDDDTSRNKMQCQLMKMATPPGVSPVFLSVEDGVTENFN